LFVDGDRGGKLIIKNVIDNADVNYIAIAPDGKEVEELAGKEILMNLRRKVSLKEFLAQERFPRRNRESEEQNEKKEIILSDDKKNKLKEISDQNQGTGKAILLNESLEEIKKVSAKRLGTEFEKLDSRPTFIVIDGIATSTIIKAAEEAKCDVIVAKNFTTTDTKIKLLSL